MQTRLQHDLSCQPQAHVAKGSDVASGEANALPTSILLMICIHKAAVGAVPRRISAAAPHMLQPLLGLQVHQIAVPVFGSLEVCICHPPLPHHLRRAPVPSTVRPHPRHLFDQAPLGHGLQPASVGHGPLLAVHVQGQQPQLCLKQGVVGAGPVAGSCGPPAVHHALHDSHLEAVKLLAQCHLRPVPSLRCVGNRGHYHPLQWEHSELYGQVPAAHGFADCTRCLRPFVGQLSCNVRVPFSIAGQAYAQVGVLGDIRQLSCAPQQGGRAGCRCAVLRVSAGLAAFAVAPAMTALAFGPGARAGVLLAVTCVIISAASSPGGGVAWGPHDHHSSFAGRVAGDTGLESAAAQRTRELCPCCKQTAETAHHFLLQCPTYNQPRTQLHTSLRTQAPTQHAQLLTMQPEEQWRQLLNEQHWNQPDTTAEIATFLMTAWKLRGEERAAAAQQQL